MTVNTGATLTIEAGVVCKMALGSVWQVSGTLIARGTAALPIVFTSGQKSPLEGDWGRIVFNPSAIPVLFDTTGDEPVFVEGSVLEYMVLEYGGKLSDNSKVYVVTGDQVRSPFWFENEE